MRRAVVDTNVLLVANRDHEDVSEECVITCIEAIDSLRRGGVTVIDDEWRILGEYTHKLNPRRGQPGAGDAFLKWLFQRRVDSRYVAEVTVTESADDWFEEFPDHTLQREFDPPDRKFIAVAAADAGNPPILQAADCKWLNWWQPLSIAGVHFRFVCPDDVGRFYSQKFPGQPRPEFPEDE
ncbi:hypothetical protein [Halomonas sp. MCCC 1A11062]|uniref:hypothetical protein n=1 Tax=Halomonas sp. MCCC 1A11062 TaxID=2733485 RepID=UPI001F20C636|nr:hypothetical protein [Halomonas sp. MCCC 1A11062]MCE8037032.1 hypothetical protein [Halomonas sp. MCCC 1A11062]